MLKSAKKLGLRFVAIDRRGYGDSTVLPIVPSIPVISTNGFDDRLNFLLDRGTEITIFVYKFIQTHRLPPISSDGKLGGVAILGWSGGCLHAFASIACVKQIASAPRETLAKYLRALIIHGKTHYHGVTIFLMN